MSQGDLFGGRAAVPDITRFSPDYHECMDQLRHFARLKKQHPGLFLQAILGISSGAISCHGLCESYEQNPRLSRIEKELLKSAAFQLFNPEGAKKPVRGDLFGDGDNHGG